MQWPTQKEQDIDRQITTQKTKDEATRNSQKTMELRFYERVSSSCSASDTRRVILVKNLVIN